MLYISKYIIYIIHSERHLCCWGVKEVESIENIKQLEVTITGTRKCDCPFRLRGKPMNNGEGWVLKVICGLHNDELAKTLVGHPCVGRLRLDGHALVVDMTQSQVKPTNILLMLKENNEDNGTTIKQLYDT